MNKPVGQGLPWLHTGSPRGNVKHTEIDTKADDWGSPFHVLESRHLTSQRSAPFIIVELLYTFGNPRKHRVMQMIFIRRKCK